MEKIELLTEKIRTVFPMLNGVLYIKFKQAIILFEFGQGWGKD